MRADAIERLQNNMQLQVWRQHADNYEIHVLLVSTQLISYDLTIPLALALSLSLSLSTRRLKMGATRSLAR